jgi:hypothetical protein
VESRLKENEWHESKTGDCSGVGTRGQERWKGVGEGSVLDDQSTSYAYIKIE